VQVAVVEAPILYSAQLVVLAVQVVVVMVALTEQVEMVLQTQVAVAVVVRLQIAAHLTVAMVVQALLFFLFQLLSIQAQPQVAQQLLHQVQTLFFSLMLQGVTQHEPFCKSFRWKSSSGHCC
jgi:hypothetical protein